LARLNRARRHPRTALTMRRAWPVPMTDSGGLMERLAGSMLPLKWETHMAIIYGRRSDGTVHALNGGSAEAKSSFRDGTVEIVIGDYDVQLSAAELAAAVRVLPPPIQRAVAKSSQP
jgi:hypothetical protein